MTLLSSSVALSQTPCYLHSPLPPTPAFPPSPPAPEESRRNNRRNLSVLFLRLDVALFDASPQSGNEEVIQQGLLAPFSADVRRAIQPFLELRAGRATIPTPPSVFFSGIIHTPYPSCSEQASREVSPSTCVLPFNCNLRLLRFSFLPLEKVVLHASRMEVRPLQVTLFILFR